MSTKQKEQNTKTNWLLMARNCSDILATFDHNKQLLSAGERSQGFISHLFHFPTPEATSIFFFVPTTTGSMPSSMQEKHTLTFQQFIDMKVVPFKRRNGNRLTVEKKEKIIQLREQGVSIAKVAQREQISRSTIQRITKGLIFNQQA